MTDGIVVIQVWGVQITAVVEPAPRSPEREALDAVVDSLGDDDVRALARIAERLRRGAALYGRLGLAIDARDFTREGQQELEDFMVYAACRWLTSEAGGGQ
jgi:hypothetical protein